MAVSSTTGGLRTGVCLSTDRPQNPYNGQVIYETDTNRTLVWDNSAWVVVADPALVSFSGTGATVTADAMTVAGENVTPYTGRRNLLYNGAMQVAQRGTSTTGISNATHQYYTADRYTTTVLNSAGTWTNSVDTDAPAGFGKSLKLTCTTAQASLGSTAAAFLAQKFEGQDLQCIAKGTSSAKQLTLSFWVKSNVTGIYVVSLYDFDNSGRTVSKQYTVSSADTWEHKTLTYPADTTGAFNNDNGVSLQMTIWLAGGSNYTSGTLNETWNSYVAANEAAGHTNLASAVNNYIQFTGVQLEVGDKATPFEHRSYGEELALCQRYYTRFSRDVGFQPVGGTGICRSTTDCSRVTVDLPTTMRTNGNAANLDYNNMVIWDGVNVRPITSFSLVQVFQNKVSLDCTTSGLTVGYPGVLLTNTASGAYFAVQTEL
jgi:RNase P/RNase MRP subunit p29